MRARWPILFLALAPLLALWPAVFGGKAIGLWDHIRTMSPWNGPKPEAPWDVLQADGVLQFAPWRSLVFDAWSQGQIPAWDNYQLMGTPLLANSQSGGFYPLHILIGLLHVPLYPAMTFLAWFHLFWAGLGCYLLVRRLGGTKTGAAIAGASFSLSAFMVYWTALPSVITTVSWIPWVLACICAIYQTDPLWGITEHRKFQTATISPHNALDEVDASMRSRNGWTSLLIASIAMMAFAGHLQFFAFGMLAAMVIALAFSVRFALSTKGARMSAALYDGDTGAEKSRTHFTNQRILLAPSLLALLRVALAVVIGVCIAAPQLLPVLEFGKQSHRRSPPTAEGYAAYVDSAIKPFELAALEFPKTIGDPSISSGPPLDLSLFWAAFVKRGNAFGESALAIGPLVLLLLCWLNKAAWRRAGPLIAVATLGILIACGTPFDYLLYYGIPGWSSTGSPGRAIILFVLAACCIAGLGLRPAMEKKSLTRGLSVFAGISLMFLFVPMLAFSGLQSFIPGLQLQSMISQAFAINLPTFLIALLIALACGALWIYKQSAAKFALLASACLIPVLLTLGVLRFGTPIDVGKPASMERVAEYNGNWNLFITPTATLPPNMATLLRIHDVAGYDSLLDKDTKALLDAANKQDSSPPENGNMMLIKPTADITALANLGVSRINANQPQQIGGQRVSSTAGPATIRDETYRSITIDAAGPGRLTLRDRNMLGWSAKIDGQPATILAGPFREIDLPPGTHVVEFTYWPPGLTTGFVLFLLGLLPLILSVFHWRRVLKVGVPGN